jgi:hypothetical protein
MSNPKIKKSTNHSKIAGDFGEHLILYWLSKYGFECAQVSHTGIDIIARKPGSKKMWGISVKSRTRNEGTESTNVRIGVENVNKAQQACDTFDCVPYFAIVVDAGPEIKAFLISLARLKHLKLLASWPMTAKYLEKYDDDKEIMQIRLKSDTFHWNIR